MENREYELVFTNIDINKLIAKLDTIGAEKIGEYFYKRVVFDFPDYRLNNVDRAWVRLRSDGYKTFLTYKKRLDVGEGEDNLEMEEIETEVADFDNAKQIFLKIGMIEKGYQENKRIRYKKDGVIFDIDIWPFINPYIEIESDNYENCKKGAELLGLDAALGRKVTSWQIYEESGYDLLKYQNITFEKMDLKKDENN